MFKIEILQNRLNMGFNGHFYTNEKIGCSFCLMEIKENDFVYVCGNHRTPDREICYACEMEKGKICPDVWRQPDFHEHWKLTVKKQDLAESGK